PWHLPASTATTASGSSSTRTSSSSPAERVNKRWQGVALDPRDPGVVGGSATFLVPLRGELVPERPGVVVLDVIHHVALSDVDRSELVVEADLGDRLLARPALGDRLGDCGLPAQQHRALGVDVVERYDGPVPRNHVIDVELPDPLECLEPLVDVRRHEPRLAAREDGVARE